LDNQDSFRNGSKNCFATNITVEANTVLSRGGISVSGAFVDDSYSASLAGNYVDGVILKDNNLFRLQNTEPDKQFLKFPIVIGGIFDTWNQAHNLSPDLLGNNVTNVNISGNMISGYNFQPLTLARDFLPNQQTLSSDQVLQWLKGTTDLASGINSFSWDWYSTPATNGTTDKYVAFGIAHLGSYPNLAFPGGIYVELEGDFANNPSLNYVFIPLLKK